MKAHIYPKNDALSRVDYPLIIEKIKSKCISDLGRQQTEKISVSTDYVKINRLLLQTAEFKTLINRGDAFPTDDYFNLTDSIEYLSIDNSVLNGKQLLEILNFIRSINKIFGFLTRKQYDYPNLYKLLGKKIFNNSLLAAIRKVIDDEGEIKQGISYDLDKLRQQRKNKEKEIDKAFNIAFRLASNNGWLTETGETVVNGRRVLAILVEHKRKIKGIIAGESATGKSINIEPDTTVELNNELIEINLDIRKEEIRILRELSLEVRSHIDDLKFYQKIIGIFDSIRAKALFALEIGAEMPIVNQDNDIELELINAFNPVLLLQNSQTKNKVVPLNLGLNKEERILIISGPNAGGKSVSIKTVMLLQLLVQSGILVPTDPKSTFKIFTHFFVEIGDSQSIENQLSTYSAHLTNLKQLTSQANQNTLFVIDELGSGTDPKFGGPIGIAVIDSLLKKYSYGIVTTHFSDIKMYGSKTEGIVSGSMIFNKETLMPTYKLSIGQPGSSHTYNIAERIGFDNAFLEVAQSYTDASYQQYDSLVSSLEAEKAFIDEKSLKLKTAEHEALMLRDAYQKLNNTIKEEKQKIIEKFKAEVFEDYKKQNKRILEALEKNNNEPLDIKELKIIQKELIETRDKVKNLGSESSKSSSKIDENIKVETWVKLENQPEMGKVIEIKKNLALVQFDRLKSWLPMEQLTVAEIDPNEKVIKKRGYSLSTSGISNVLDVRGMRTDEALQKLEKLLDYAILANYKRLQILHGRGTGILRKQIRTTLKKYDIVKSYEDEHADHGGDGITIVNLK